MEQYPDFHRDHLCSRLFGVVLFPRTLKPVRDVWRAKSHMQLPACGSSSDTMAADNPEADAEPVPSDDQRLDIQVLRQSGFYLRSLFCPTS